MLTKNRYSKQNPFAFDIDEVESRLQIEFIESQSDESLKTAFHEGHNLVRSYSSRCETKFGKLNYYAKQTLSVFGTNPQKSKYASRSTDGHLNAIL